MANKEILYLTQLNEFQFFFNESGELLHFWHTNDADYRSEYMNPLFKALGYKVQYIKPDNEKVSKKIKEVLTNIGCYEEY